jgi:hypothetical protein
MLCILLCDLGLVTAVSIQLGPSHLSPNNLLLMPSILMLSVASLKGSTKRTLPGMVLYKLYNDFFHVFQVYSVLLSTDFMSTCISGDQGEPFFSDKSFFLSFYVQIGVLQFVQRV